VSANAVKFLILAAVLPVAVILSASVGRYGLPPATVAEIFASRIAPLTRHWTAQAETVVFDIRLPRIAAALLVGLALSTSGAAYQALFRNPLVSPDILGVSAGAGFGASIGLLLSYDPVTVQALAFAFGLMATLATYAVATRFGTAGDATLLLILAGIIIEMLFLSLQSAIKYVADPNNTLPAITYWLMGGLSSVNPHSVAIAAGPILAGFAVTMLLRWTLDIMTFGTEEARALGVNTTLIRGAVVLSATVMTACAVALSGVLGLLGLVIPHIARAWLGPSFSALIPGSALIGAILVLFMDDLARTLLSTELPLGVLAQIIGAPLFLVLLVRSRKGWR
jgi:iron complex transport system permease protein